MKLRLYVGGSSKFHNQSFINFLFEELPHQCPEFRVSQEDIEKHPYSMYLNINKFFDGLYSNKVFKPKLVLNCCVSFKITFLLA